MLSTSPTRTRLDELHRLAGSVAQRSVVPYSGQRAAVVLLLDSGEWVAGVRVETASFSLVIPAIINAFTTAEMIPSSEVVAGACSGDLQPADLAFLDDHHFGPFEAVGANAFVRAGLKEIPEVTGAWNPYQPVDAPLSPADGIAWARRAAERAFVPESDFKVGCAIETADGKLLLGANIEHSDWSRVLCAERNALGTAASYGVTNIVNLYLTCSDDDGCSPCGACRQVIAELAPNARVWMDTGGTSFVETTPDELLPGYFTGTTLTRKA